MGRPQIIIVDDETAVGRAVELRLRGVVRVVHCVSIEKALNTISKTRFDAALVDVNLGGQASGHDLVVRVRELDPDLATIIFTGHANYKTALQSLSTHSFDFIPKRLNDERMFEEKLYKAIEHTRQQRLKTRFSTITDRLRAELANAILDTEFEVTERNLQRGLLVESLQSFTSLLGHVEFLNLKINDGGFRYPMLTDLKDRSSSAVREMREYVGKLRDYTARPRQGIGSVNEIVDRAARVVQEEIAETDNELRLEWSTLKPNVSFPGDSRALLAAIVILLRLVARSGVKTGVVTLTPTLVLHPRTEMATLRSRNSVRILRAAEFHERGCTVVGIEIRGPNKNTGADQAAEAFREDYGIRPALETWCVLAMVGRLNGVFLVEARPGIELRYRIMVEI